MKINKIGLIILAIVVLLACTFFSLPYYLRRALIHKKPKIDQYTIFDNRTIKAGKAEAWLISPNYNQFKLSPSMQDSLEKYKTTSFLVIQDGQIQFEKYWLGCNKDTYSNSFSMAKSIISLLIGVALEQGKIKSLDEPVGNYIPHFAKGNNKKLTIKHLLTMSAGLSWKEAYSSPMCVTTQAYYGKSLPKLMETVDVAREPGKVFNYQSGATQLLAIVLQTAVNKNISEFASESLWQKIGSERDALWCLDQEGGLEKAFCCFISNARDFARFGQLALNKGKWKNQQVVSERYFQEALTPASYLMDTTNHNSPVDFYGYQWWIVRHGQSSIYYMRGILGQYVMVWPEKKAIIVRLGKERSETKRHQTPIDAYNYIDIAESILK